MGQEATTATEKGQAFRGGSLELNQLFHTTADAKYVLALSTD